MKILLYSHSFWPSIGGVERVSHNLAKGFAEAGHLVSVVTETASADPIDAPYSVVRRPSPDSLRALIQAQDLVHSSGSSLRCFPGALLSGKPFSWTHHGYQLQCLDGAGWLKGAPAPLMPLPSILHHWQQLGAAAAATGACKLWLRRLAGQLCSANVATSMHSLQRQPLPRQRLIYNPIDFESVAVRDREEAERNVSECRSTFSYVGRLVTEKGVDDLIHAFAIVVQDESVGQGGRISTLEILGDGPERESLQLLAKQLGVSERISWSTALLADESRRLGICVIPSAWEEPGALIVLELMAAGKPLIVSEKGCLSECAERAALVFPNRNRVELAKTMMRLRDDAALRSSLIGAAILRAKLFEPKNQIDKYLELFAEIKARF